MGFVPSLCSEVQEVKHPKKKMAVLFSFGFEFLLDKCVSISISGNEITEN